MSTGSLRILRSTRAEDGSVGSARYSTSVQQKVIPDEGGARENLDHGLGEILGHRQHGARIVHGHPNGCAHRRLLFGCVMDETLSGHLAVDGDNSYDDDEQAYCQPRAGFIVENPVCRCHQRWCEFIPKALQKDPDDRFQNFDELKRCAHGVEPAITKEIKDLLFLKRQHKALSKKKKSLKKRILMSVWTVVLVALSIFGLMTYDQMSINSIQGISKKFEGKIVT